MSEEQKQLPPPRVNKRPRQFPKLPRVPGQRGNALVDIAKVREMYLSGAHYTWRGFCEANGFPEESRSNAWFKDHVDFREWKREWVKRKNEVSEEAITPQMIDCTKMIAESRIAYVQTWSSISKNMKALLTHLLSEHVKAAAADLAAEKSGAVAVVGHQKNLKLDIEELESFASAGNRIAELEARALMIVGGDRNAARKAMAIDDEDKPTDDKVPELEIVPIGQSMSAAERTKMIAEYFDQFQKPADPPPPLPAEKLITEAAEDASEDD